MYTYTLTQEKIILKFKLKILNVVLNFRIRDILGLFKQAFGINCQIKKKHI